MGESTDLIRRLDSAISTKSLHPEYARGLLREAKEALEEPTKHPMKRNSSYPSNGANDPASPDRLGNVPENSEWCYCIQCRWHGSEDDTVWTDNELEECAGEDHDATLSCPVCHSSNLLDAWPASI